MLFLPFTHPYLDPVHLCEEAQITVVSPAESFFSKMEINNAIIAQNIGLFKMIVGVIHSTLQMQPHVISFCGVLSRIRFMFFLLPQVSQN